MVVWPSLDQTGRSPIEEMLKQRHAFTLIEIMLSVVIGGALISGLLLLLYSEITLQSPVTKSQTTAYGSSQFPVVPSSGALNDAVRTMDVFQSAVSDASAVFVIGGASISPAPSPDLPVAAAHLFPATGVLGAGQIAVSTSNIPQTSADFASLLTTRPGIQWETTADSADFTVVTVSGLNQISTVTQVRRIIATVDGVSTAFYEVVCDTNLSAARSSATRFAYRLCLPAAEDAAWTLPIGALHYWFRVDNAWGRREEGPTRLVFPDPFVMAGIQGNNETAPFSRFIFFLSPNT